MLKKFHADSDILKNVFIFYGPNKDGADRIAESLGLLNVKTFDRKSGLKHLSSEWNEFEKDTSEGFYKVPQTAYTRNDENMLMSAFGINDLSEAPSLIIIDEVTHFTSYDLDIIQKVAKKYGITIIAAGDYDQSGATGKHKFNHHGTNPIWTMQTYRHMFIRSPKLGISMRTKNSIKSYNVQLTLIWMLNPLQNLELSYYEDETGIYGDKVYSYYDGDSYSAYIENILEDVDKMISTLEPGQKIGYIFDDATSELTNALSDDKYKPYIQLFPGTSAQGFEGQYYIIDLQNTADTKQYLKHIYTGISRSELGSIVVVPSDIANGYTIESKQVNEKIDEDISDEVIKSYSDKRKKILDEIVETGEPVQINPRNKTNTTTSRTNAPSNNSNRGLLPGMNPIAPPEVIQTKPTILANIDSVEDIAELDLLVHDLDSELRNDPDVAKAIEEKYAEFLNIPEIQLVSIEDTPVDIRLDLIDLSNNLSDDTDYGCSLHLGDIVRIEHEGSQTYWGVIKNIEKISDSDFTLTVVDPNELQPNDENELIPIEKNEPISDVTGVVKDLEEYTEPPVTVDSEYIDPVLPVVTSDVENTDTHNRHIDEDNEDEFKPVVEEDSTGSKLTLLMHTFNSHERGVNVDENGYPIPVGSQEWMDARRDSVNGLIYLEKLQALKKGIEWKPKKIEEYDKIISLYRSLLFNTESKAELCQIFSLLFEIDDIYITFALKKSAIIGENTREKNQSENKEFLGDTPNPMEKGLNERSLFNESDDSRSSEVNRQHIVAIIGSKENGDILELPLLLMSSPITLMRATDPDGNPVYADVQKVFDNTNGNIYEKCSKVIEEFDGQKSLLPLIDLFKLFTVSDNIVRFINDDNWTIAKDLKLKGLQFSIERGVYQEEEGFSYDLKWTPLNKFTYDENYNPSGNTDRVVSSLLIPNDNFLDGVDESVVKRGNCCVLISNDLTLQTDQQLIDQWEEQQRNPNAKHKVKLVYVAAPKASFDEYLDAKYRILRGEKNVPEIGQLFTAYKLWRTLLTSDRSLEIKDALSRDEYTKKMLPAIELTIAELDAIDNPKEQVAVLLSQRNWSEYGFSNSLRTLSGLLDAGLLNMCYNKSALSNLVGHNTDMSPNLANIDLVKSILEERGIDGVYYRVGLGENPSQIGLFYIPKIGPNYTLDGKDFMIHGKIDSYVFSGDMHWLYGNINEWTHTNSKGHLHSTDGARYMKYDSRISGTTPPSRRPRPRKKPITPEIDTKTLLDPKIEKAKTLIKFYTGEDVDVGKLNVQDALNLAVSKINSSGKAIAFRIGDDIRAGKHLYDELNGVITIQDLGGNPIYDISTYKTSGGEYVFNLIVNEVQYQASFNSNNHNLELIPPTQSFNSELILNVNEDSFQEYMSSALNLLQDIFEYDDGLLEVFANSDYSSFVNSLRKLNNDPDRKSDIEELISGLDPSMENYELLKQILEDILIALEYNEDESQSCSLNALKIIFDI